MNHQSGQSTAFAERRHGNLHWQVREDCLDERLTTLLNDPENWLRTRARLFKGFERSSTVGVADGWVLKRHNRRQPLNVLKDLFRPSRARRAFRHARLLEAKGIATPRAIAVAERRCCRILLAGYLVTEEIHEARDLGEYLGSVVRPDKNVVCAIAQLFARLHEEGFSHRDLKESNILLDHDLAPYLIDLDGLKHLGRVSDVRAAADLQRFARGATKFKSVTRRERISFLKRYCRIRKLRRIPRL